MKIDWKSKETRIIAVIIAVIVLPILYNQGKTLITAAITAYQMSQPKTVQVGHPIEKEIYPEFYTTGRLQAKYSVNIVARVEGWLEKRFFDEGDTVKKGQKIFQIEPDDYILAEKDARASVNENRALFENSQISLKRAKALLKQDFVSQEYYDDAFTERNKHRALLDGSIAQLKRAKLNLSYTSILSPMDGRIGTVMITEGNYVTPTTGTLVTIYSTNPMRAVFTVKSGDFIAMKRYFLDKNNGVRNEKSHIEARDYIDNVEVILKLADGSTYKSAGKIEYVDNQIDESTGSIALRAVFDNKNEILVHGDFVNVILRLKRPSKVMTIPQSATKTDLGTGYYVWVVKDNKVEKRNVTVVNNIDNNWVVEKGLDYNDTIVMKGIQDIYQGGQVVKTEPYKPDEDKTTSANAEQEEGTVE